MGSTKDDVYPPDPETMKIFEAIGGAIGVESLREYQVASVGSALLAVAAGVHETSVRWLLENGMEPAAARAYVSGFDLRDRRRGACLSRDSARRCPAALQHGRRHQRAVLCSLPRAALEAAMDAVLESVRATPTESTLDGGAP